MCPHHSKNLHNLSEKRKKSKDNHKKNSYFKNKNKKIKEKIIENYLIKKGYSKIKKETFYHTFQETYQEDAPKLHMKITVYTPNKEEQA